MRSDDCALVYPSTSEECFTHAIGDPACNLQLELSLAANTILSENAYSKMLRKFTSVDQEPRGVVGRAYARTHRWAA